MPKTKNVVVSFSLPEDSLNQLKEEAKTNERTFSAHMRFLTELRNRQPSFTRFIKIPKRTR